MNTEANSASSCSSSSSAPPPVLSIGELKAYFLKRRPSTWPDAIKNLKNRAEEGALVGGRAWPPEPAQTAEIIGELSDWADWHVAYDQQRQRQQQAPPPPLCPVSGSSQRGGFRPFRHGDAEGMGPEQPDSLMSAVGRGSRQQREAAAAAAAAAAAERRREERDQEEWEEQQRKRRRDGELGRRG